MLLEMIHQMVVGVESALTLVCLTYGTDQLRRHGHCVLEQRGRPNGPYVLWRQRSNMFVRNWTTDYSRIGSELTTHVICFGGFCGPGGSVVIGRCKCGPFAAGSVENATPASFPCSSSFMLPPKGLHHSEPIRKMKPNPQGTDGGKGFPDPAGRNVRSLTFSPVCRWGLWAPLIVICHCPTSITVSWIHGQLPIKT